MAKKLFEEMREIVANDRTTNKTLLRFLVTGVAELNEQVEMLIENYKKYEEEINEISKKLGVVEKTTTSNFENIKILTKDVEIINNNLVIKIGKYLQNHFKTSILITIFLILFALHIFGIVINIEAIFEQIKNFIFLLI